MTDKRRILVLLNPARFWRWQKWVVDELDGNANYHVELRRGSTSAGIPAGLDLLLRLEGLLYGKAHERACDIVAPELPENGQESGHDLVLDFSAMGDMGAERFLRPVFDGYGDEMAAVDALLSRRLPELGAMDEAGYHVLGTSASEQPLVLGSGLDQCFSRMAELLLRQVRARLGGKTASPAARITKPQTCGPGFKAAGFAFSSLMAKINGRLKLLSKKAPRWAIGWRQIRNDAAHDTLRIEPEKFMRFADDGRRFFADPFIFVHGGKTHVFCEEFPFSTRKGVISVFTIGQNGAASETRVVLERPYHLSYPFVFTHDGQIWMIPESSGNRTVELYRAVSFPDKWTLEKVLLSDLLADDASLHITEGRLWLFAATRKFNSSSWDSLGLFSATDLLGEWSAHRANPVLCDVRSARPGGALFRHGGDLWRPAQDCAAGYGAGLALSRITQLDDEGFAQTDTRILQPEKPLNGMHTLNAGGGFEVIDMFGEFS